MSNTHVPVLLKEVVEYLNAAKGRKFVDGTAGSGGHIFGVLEKNPQAKILGIDLDQTSLDNLRKAIAARGLDQNVVLVQGSYSDLDKITESQDFGNVDGILVDLGFSSTQLDDAKRGFSFQTDSPLDMRYDLNGKRTAADVVNHYHQKELEEVIHDYGEDRFYRRIASNIIAQRKIKPIETTLELAEVVRKAIPAPLRFKAQDNIRRVFQAIRIEVNDELKNLKVFLPQALERLNPGGRLVVISFHSLEDRIVKEFFNEQAKGCICPVEFPTCVCGKTSKIRILSRKPVTATEEELANNSKAKPAKLRAAEKIKN